MLIFTEIRIFKKSNYLFVYILNVIVIGEKDVRAIKSWHKQKH